MKLTDNQRDLLASLSNYPEGTKVVVSTSQYQTQWFPPSGGVKAITVYSTASTIKSLVKRGLIEADFTWRAATVTVPDMASVEQALAVARKLNAEHPEDDKLSDLDFQKIESYVQEILQPAS